MSNQTAATLAAIANAVNWERKGLNLQDITEAANQGKLGRPLTDWLVARGWETSSVSKPAAELPKPVLSILEFGSLVVVQATASEFVAKDKFVVNTKLNAPVKISAVWDNFTTWFLSGKGKTETSISEQTLRYAKLCKASVDGPIIAELGGEAKAETTLSEMFSLMEKQKHGEDGVLLNNGYANIFYIKDQKGVLRTVYLRWLDVGWSVIASSVESDRRWDDGGQVFSRNSVIKSSETLVTAQA